MDGKLGKLGKKVVEWSGVWVECGWVRGWYSTAQHV
jgi:hypothetical protein